MKTHHPKIEWFPRIGSIRPPIGCMFCILLLCGCATFHPQPQDESWLRQRAVTREENGVRVSAAVLSAGDTETVFGLQLYKKGIQPLWLEIENHTRHRMWFPPVSVDRNYYSPLEVAYMCRSGYTTASRRRMEGFFHRHAIRNPIDPGETRSGFLFTNVALGTKAFNVEVVGNDHQVRTFTFLIPVAGLKVDHREVDWRHLYPADAVVALGSLQKLKNALEDMPCCTTNADGRRMADPINVVMIGRGRDILYALLRSGWDETAAASTFDPLAQLPWTFRYQPVKPLYLFDRAQDAAFRKSRSALNERNQLRLWLSPLIYQGQQVWIGQISRIVRRGVWDRFIIEPDVDEARTYLLQNLWFGQALLRYGYVTVAEVATLSDPRMSLHDGTYFTDGLCLVLWVAGEPVSFSEVQFAPWEEPTAERRRLLLGQ